MTQAQHTQGPWEVMAHENGSFTVFEGGHAKNWADWSIAELNFTVQDAANAQLIAAAPDLLEACKAIAALADGQGRKNMLEVAAMARIVIAKVQS